MKMQSSQWSRSEIARSAGLLYLFKVFLCFGSVLVAWHIGLPVGWYHILVCLWAPTIEIALVFLLVLGLIRLIEKLGSRV
jgi:hypothetical protein